MLGADLWLTGLSGAQSVGHSTNLRYPCPLMTAGEGATDRLVYSLADWFSGRPTDPMMMREWLSCWLTCRSPSSRALCLTLFHASLNSTPPAFLRRNLACCYIWSLSVDLTLYNSSHSLVPLCESMISRDCSVFSVLAVLEWTLLAFLSVIVCWHAARLTQPLQLALFFYVFLVFRGLSWKGACWINILLLHMLCFTSQGNKY